MDYSFDVMRLGKQIKCGNRGEMVTTSDQLLQIAGECRRVARDVRDSLWPKAQDAGNDARLRAGARRVKQNEIDLILESRGRSFR